MFVNYFVKSLSFIGDILIILNLKIIHCETQISSQHLFFLFEVYVLDNPIYVPNTLNFQNIFYKIDI
ncbi:hypothetical protein ACBE110449_21780 [Acinetobacter bereziniae]|uniref:Uncharacterized protein n=1 Tax=Acinetobacter bereziniae NIPH 3 TaxID=1217651 RepID=N8YNR3_ACIBZ|nr:hypothetical protein F963_03036 [Acinetobacter bereziniae NIPH 3]